MKIYYRPDGRIAAGVLSQYYSLFDPSTLTNPQLVVEVDESTNGPLCADINAHGIEGKYMVNPTTQELLIDELWQNPLITNPLP